LAFEFFQRQVFQHATQPAFVVDHVIIGAEEYRWLLDALEEKSGEDVVLMDRSRSSSGYFFCPMTVILPCHHCLHQTQDDS